MAKHGLLFERDNFIPKCQNRAGMAEIDLDGGAIVAEGAIVAGDDELYTLTAPVGTETRVGIVYNPSVKYDVIGTGKMFPARSLDDRDYFNPAGKPVDYFFPEVGVEFGVIGANVEGSTAPVVGDFLEVTSGKTTYTISASQTSGVPSFEVVQIINKKYPTFDFTDDVEPVYIVKTRFNG